MPTKTKRAKIKPIPDDRHCIVPRLSYADAAKAMAWYKRAFRAVEIMRFAVPDGKIAHAEMKIGNAVFALTDGHPDDKTPLELGGHTVVLDVYVQDVDSFVNRAVKAGAKIIYPVGNAFYGDRGGRIEDPFGHSWGIGSRIENMTPAEMKRRLKAKSGG